MKKHYASKYEFPTRHIGTSKTTRKGGQISKKLSIGHERARIAVESRIGRPLDKNSKIKTLGGNWCFIEP